LEVAAGEQHGGAGGGQVRVLALEPGAGPTPRVGEPIGLAPRRGAGRVGVAARPAPQHRDVVPPGTDHVGQSSGRSRGLSSLVCPRRPRCARPRYIRAMTTAADPSRERWNRRWAGERANAATTPSAFLIAETEALPPGRALDVACGAGRNAVWLAQRGWRVTGVDFSDVALQAARELAAASGVE